MLLAGRQTHNNIELYYGFEGFFFMGSIMGSQNIMGSDYGSNRVTLVKTEIENDLLYQSLTNLKGWTMPFSERESQDGSIEIPIAKDLSDDRLYN